MPPAFDKERTALLVMDYQRAIVENYSGDSRHLLGKAGRALEAARGAGLPVLYVVVGFRPGYPEVSPRNKSFGALSQSGRFAAGSPGTEIHPDVAPREGEAVVVKHRVSAFSGSDLEMILRARGLDTLVLAGISTSGVVLSTLRQAADLDFRLVVLKDACADPNDSVHACLMDLVFPRQAEVMDAEEFARTLE